MLAVPWELSLELLFLELTSVTLKVGKVLATAKQPPSKDMYTDSFIQYAGTTITVWRSYNVGSGKVIDK